MNTSKANKRPWTQEEADWLKENYQSVNIFECSKKLNRSPSAITSHANRVLNVRRPIKWTLEQNKFLIENYSKMSLTDLSIKLDKSIESIISKGNRYGLKLGKNFHGERKRKDVTLNQNFFETIDSFEKAYLLGWIWSDGSIGRNNTLRFCLSKKDEDVLHYMKDTLNSMHNVKYYNNNGFDYAYFQVCSPKMISDLLNKNVTYNKTYSQIEPIVPEEFMDGFLLGLLDGDGCAYYNKKYVAISFAGTTTTVKFIKNFLEKKWGKKINKVGLNKESQLFARLDILSQKDVKKLYDFLYSRPKFFLRRKEKVFRDVLKFEYKQKASVYNGVGFIKGRPVARIGYGGDKEFLGYFETQEEAAKAYDKRLMEVKGGLTKLNFPITDEQISQ